MGKPSERFPPASGHDLRQLARRAGVKPASDAEIEALESGGRIIENPGTSPASPGELCRAYRALFLRAVDAAARAVWERTENLRTLSRSDHATEEVAVYRMFIEGVYAPATGEEGLDLF